MTATTTKGMVRKEITKDGRESPINWAKRAVGLEEPTKTKEKRAKQAREDLEEAVNDPTPDK